MLKYFINIPTSNFIDTNFFIGFAEEEKERFGCKFFKFEFMHDQFLS